MTFVQSILPQPVGATAFEEPHFSPETIEKTKSLMLTMPPELWQASQEALVQNNNNLLKR